MVIVGAGPTGMCAAIMLAQRGIDCLVLERWPTVYPLPRAVHFDDEVFRVFADLGIAEEVRAIARPAPGLQLVDRDLRVLAEFTRDPAGRLHGYPQANMFDQPTLDRVLRERLGQLSDARLCTGVEVTGVDDGADAGDGGRVVVRYREVDTGRQHEVRADAVLGCDGANSRIRDHIGAGMQSLQANQQWLVVDARSDEPLTGYAVSPDVAYDGVQQVCDPDRSATFMLVTPGHYRWEFPLAPGARAEDLDDDAVSALLSPWLGRADLDRLTILRRAGYTYRAAVADHWRRVRVFLLGDAAHLTPPFIGQGMCAGIRDAANLTWKLALVLDGTADERLLDTYETERRPYARRVVRMAILVGWLMTGGSARTRRQRHAVLRALGKIRPVRDRALTAVWPAFRAGALVSAHDRLAGRICPQPSVRLPNGEPLGLDRVVGPGFVVIAWHRALAPHDQTAEARAFFDDLGTVVVDLDDCDVTSGPGRHLANLLDRAGAQAILVRPDRIVVASAERVDLVGWRRQLMAAGLRSVPPGPSTNLGAVEAPSETRPVVPANQTAPPGVETS